MSESKTDLSQAEIIEMFGGEAGAVEVNADEVEVSLALQALRAQLLEAAEKMHVGINQLSRRLHISPSAVSRFLGGEGDMKVSTAVLYARALGQRWGIFLTPDDGCLPQGNRQGKPEMSLSMMNAGPGTYGTPYTVSVGRSTSTAVSPASKIEITTY